MLIKIKREDFLKDYPEFPIRGYDVTRDEELFSYPKIFASYVLTLTTKSFKDHIKLLGTELTELTKEMKINTLFFL